MSLGTAKCDKLSCKLMWCQRQKYDQKSMHRDPMLIHASIRPYSEFKFMPILKIKIEGSRNWLMKSIGTCSPEPVEINKFNKENYKN